MKKKTIGIIILIFSAAAAAAYFFYSRRWQPFEDNNFVGNRDFNAVAFLTDYDTKLAVGDKVEIKQNPHTSRKEEYEGKAEIVGLSTTPAGKYLFITDKPWSGVTPKIGGTWRKLNLI